MILKEMITKLRLPCLFEIRDFQNNGVCKTLSDSKGVKPYINYEIIEWFVARDNANTICVLINDEAETEWESDV